MALRPPIHGTSFWGEDAYFLADRVCRGAENQPSACGECCDAASKGCGNKVRMAPGISTIGKAMRDASRHYRSAAGSRCRIRYSRGVMPVRVRKRRLKFDRLLKPTS